jgi:hypothetical protein
MQYARQQKEDVGEQRRHDESITRANVAADRQGPLERRTLCDRA